MPRLECDQENLAGERGDERQSAANRRAELAERRRRETIIDPMDRMQRTASRYLYARWFQAVNGRDPAVVRGLCQPLSREEEALWNEEKKAVSARFRGRVTARSITARA